MKKNALALEEQLCFAFYKAHKSFTKVYKTELSKLGLTYPQYLVMLVLWEEPEIVLTLSDIGARLSLDSGTLTPLLKRLETQGFITRSRNPEDEREILIELTKHGRSLQKSATGIPKKLISKTKLSATESVRLRNQVNTLVETLEQ